MLNFVVDVLLPPTSLTVLALLLLIFGGRRSRAMATVLTAIVVVLAIPAVAGALLDSLAPPSAPAGPEPGAIVILSADAVHLPGADDLEPGPLTLDRLRAGAALERRDRVAAARFGWADRVADVAGRHDEPQSAGAISA